MTDPALGAWLRRERKETRGWSQLEMARRLIRAARDTDGEDPVPAADSIKRRIQCWEKDGTVSLRYRRLYCRAFGIPLPQFGKTADPAPTALAAPPLAEGTGPVGSLLPISSALTYRGSQAPVWDEFTLGQEVLMAGHESSGHAADREPSGIGETTFEQLRADVVRLSWLTDTGPPLLSFRELRRVRDRIHLLLDRRLLLRETSGLYFLLGCVNVLLGINANRLGYPGTAEELLRAGWTYANIIEHNPLRAVVRSNLAVVMYQSGRYGESRDLVADGLRYVSVGSWGANLHCWHAHAAARLGDLDTARQSVALADNSRDADYNDDLLEIGGMFTITRAAHQSLAGRALASVNGAERYAAEKLEQAIGLYDAGPEPSEVHWFAGKPMAGVNLAIVRLRSGALDAAAAALEHALALPAEQRVSDITGRLADVRRELAAPIFQGSPQARDLGERIEAFSREAVTSGLRSLTG